MGSCLQAIFSPQRSALRQDPLLNYQELTTIIKPSTQNDQLFFACPILSAAQKFLSEFSQKPNLPLDSVLIKSYIAQLSKFILDLKDHSSQIGKQIILDQQRIKTYVEQEGERRKGEQGLRQGEKERDGKGVRENTVVLRLEIQMLLLGMGLREDLACEGDWELVIEVIQERERQRNVKGKGSRETEIESSQEYRVDSLKVQKQEPFEIIKVKQHKKQSNQSSSPTKMIKYSKKKPKSPSPHKNSNQIEPESESQLQQFEIFHFINKVVHKNSNLRINLCKIKRKKYLTVTEMGKPSNPNPQPHPHPKPRNSTAHPKTILGKTCLSISDFLYYNSLIITDIIPLTPPSSIKSSITTSITSTSSTANAVAFLSLRGQGLRAETLQRDYVRIVKQHQGVLRQLGLCLEGERGWEKLSEVRGSSGGSRRSEYSQYSGTMELRRGYKM